MMNSNGTLIDLEIRLDVGCNQPNTYERVTFAFCTIRVRSVVQNILMAMVYLRHVDLANFIEGNFMSVSPPSQKG